jgi:hypothetical protein
MVQTNKPVNLGPGFPDFTAQPKSLIEALVDVTLNGDFSVNQYTRGYVSLFKVTIFYVLEKFS